MTRLAGAVLVAAAAIVLALIWIDAPPSPSSGSSRWDPEAIHRLELPAKMTGLAAVPGPRSGLVATLANGSVIRLTLDGEVTRHHEVAGTDRLDDITRLPESGQFLLLESARARFHRVTLDPFQIRDTLKPFGMKPAGAPETALRGFGLVGGEEEGLVLQEEPPALRTVSLWESRLPLEIPVAAPRPCDLMVSPDGTEVVILSRSEGLRLLSTDGTPVGSWQRLPASNLRCCALIPGRAFYVAADSHLLVFPHLGTWTALRDRLVTDG